MTTIYHVCRGEWDGRDLTCLARHMEWDDAAAEYISANWPDCNAWEYYSTEGRWVHCHATLDEAREFANEFGGQVLAIDTSELIVETGIEYPHPVVREIIPATAISVL